MITYDDNYASKEARFCGNLGFWNKQRAKLVEFAYSLIDQGFEYDAVLDRTQSWNVKQAIKFLPYYVFERVNYAWRKSHKKQE